MIKMVEAENVKPGDIISTDGLVVKTVMVVDYLTSYVTVAGICHGIWKRETFKKHHELPIYYDDSDPED